MGDHLCIAVAGPSGSGKSTLARRLEGVYVLVADDYFHDYGAPDYYTRPEWDTPRAYDFPLLEDHGRRLLAGEEVQLARYNFDTGRREPGARAKLAPGQALVVEGLYAFLAELPFDRKIFVDATFPLMVERCLPRDQGERGRTDLKKILKMYEDSWEKYAKELFPQKEQADLVLPPDWLKAAPERLRLEELERLAVKPALGA